MNFQEAKELAKKFIGSKIKPLGGGSFHVITRDGQIVYLQNQIKNTSEAPQDSLPQNNKPADITLEEELLAAIEDSQKVIDQKDCDDFVKIISELMIHTSNAVVLGDARRRILEIELIRPTLPSAEESEADNLVLQGLKYLRANPPRCGLCGSVMILQQNNKEGSANKGEYFWGCQNFALPNSRDSKKCYSRRQLSPTERARVGTSPKSELISTVFEPTEVPINTIENTKEIYSGIDEDLKLRMNNRYNQSRKPSLPSGPNLDRMQNEKEARERNLVENGPKPRPFETPQKELLKLKNKGPTAYTVSEGIAGSREDNIKMRARQWGEMVNRGRK